MGLLQTQVAILLATRNGERFLGAQLQSYVSQTHGDWTLHVSDDGSSDATWNIIEKFAAEQSRFVSISEGPKQGFCRNFMSLAQSKSVKADYFAFSDQDDIWHADKLERALSYLKEIPQTQPAMYCSRTELVDEDLRHVGFSPLFSRPPSFRNALVQSIGGGNTIVFNAAAKSLFEATGNAPIVSHDWWAYQIVSGAGGTVFYDPQPSLKYRQHGNNIVGSNLGFAARLSRIRMTFGGRLELWNETNVRALHAMRSHLTAFSLETLDKFVAAREARWLPTRLYYFFKCGVYRQGVLENLGLVAVAVLRKL